MIIPSPYVLLPVVAIPLTTSNVPVAPLPEVAATRVGLPRIFPALLYTGVPEINLVLPELSVQTFVSSLKFEATNLMYVAGRLGE